jgi:hypothetical protein
MLVICATFIFKLQNIIDLLLLLFFVVDYVRSFFLIEFFHKTLNILHTRYKNNDEKYILS